MLPPGTGRSDLLIVPPRHSSCECSLPVLWSGISLWVLSNLLCEAHCRVERWLLLSLTSGLRIWRWSTEYRTDCRYFNGKADFVLGSTGLLWDEESKKTDGWFPVKLSQHNIVKQLWLQ